MKVFHLVIYSGATVSRVYVLRKEKIVIGRDPGCDLELDSMDVSRRHALLRCSDADVTIEDMGSTNGTKINGEKVESEQKLNPRDVITLGKEFRLVFQVVDSVRSGKKDDTESGWRPAYPLPLPQTMMLGQQDFAEYLAKENEGEDRNDRASGSISPPTMPRPTEFDEPEEE